jgi:hypothetical protein
MNNEDNQDRERDMRERIVSLMRATEQAKQRITGDELERLKTAASRLDEMLKASTEADLQALRSAAARLDRLLADLGTGKDVTGELKRQRDWRNRDD